MQLTPHFTLEELIFSQTALERRINNTPLTQEIINNLRFTAAGLERIRAALDNHPILISSGFRCNALNSYVGGEKESQHLLGEAIDFTCPTFGGPREIIRTIEEGLDVLGIDQLILEPNWVHVSFTYSPRHELLTKLNGKYLKGFV